MEYGTITGISSEKNMDGDRTVRLLDVKIRDNDSVTVELDVTDQREFAPRIGAKVYFSEITPTYLVADRVVDESVQVDTGLGSGESCEFAISPDGERVATVTHRADGSVEVGEPDEPVAMSGVLDRFVSLVDDIMTNSVDPLMGGAWATAKAAAFPETGGMIPESASNNLSAEVRPLIPEAP